MTAVDPRLITAPRLRRSSGRAARVHRNTRSALARHMPSKSASDSRSIGPLDLAPGVVHEDVDSAEGVDGGGHHRPRVGIGGDVGHARGPRARVRPRARWRGDPGGRRRRADGDDVGPRARPAAAPRAPRARSRRRSRRPGGRGATAPVARGRVGHRPPPAPAPDAPITRARRRPRRPGCGRRGGSGPRAARTRRRGSCRRAATPRTALVPARAAAPRRSRRSRYAG